MHSKSPACILSDSLYNRLDYYTIANRNELIVPKSSMGGVMFKKCRKQLILAILFSCISTSVFALVSSANVLRVALLDTAYNEMPVNPSLLAEYGRAYLAGVQTASEVAKQYNINIVD